MAESEEERLARLEKFRKFRESRMGKSRQMLQRQAEEDAKNKKPDEKPFNRVPTLPSPKYPRKPQP